MSENEKEDRCFSSRGDQEFWWRRYDSILNGLLSDTTWVDVGESVETLESCAASLADMAFERYKAQRTKY